MLISTKPTRNMHIIEWKNPKTGKWEWTSTLPASMIPDAVAEQESWGWEVRVVPPLPQS